MSEYVINRETGKLELHFDKEDYLNLDAEKKDNIKKHFLFSRKQSAWVSKAKFPHLDHVEKIAKDLGLSNGGKVGETISFAEQMNIKARKAEKRANMYEHKSDMAKERGERMQKPINDMGDDIAFFTQPNINTVSGKAFTNQRNRMFDSYMRGFDEFSKSEYYAEKAKIARETANQTMPTDKGFIVRRINDAEKTIKAQSKNLEKYRERLEQIEAGEELRKISGEIITKEEVEGWIEESEEIIDNAISKSVYYHECLNAVGGVQFSKENIKPGYIVEVENHGKCKVISTGKVNFTFENMTGEYHYQLKASYAEINKIISDEVIDKPLHPFKVGESFTIKVWENGGYKSKEYKVTKITNEKVTLKSGDERAISRKPRSFYDSKNEKCWALDIADSYQGAVYKREA